MIDEAAVAAMKRDAWLINVARGRLIDDTALLRALRENRIGGAALDTFRDEPLPQIVALLGAAERDPHPAHRVVVGPRPRPHRSTCSATTSSASAAARRSGTSSTPRPAGDAFARREVQIAIVGLAGGARPPSSTR